MKILFFILLSLSVSLISSFGLVAKNGLKLLSPTDESKNLVVYLNGHASEESIQQVLGYLSSIPGHSESKLQESSVTLSEFEAAFPTYARGLREDDSLLAEIPKLITSTFLRNLDPNSLQTFVAELQTKADVLSVESSFSWSDSLKKLKRYSITGVGFVSGTLIVVILSLTFLLIFRFIASERERLEIMSFCGASPRQLYNYLFQKFVAAMAAAIIAGLALTSGFAYLAYFKLSTLQEISLFVNQLSFFNLSELSLLCLAFAVSFILCLFLSMKLSLAGAWQDE